MSSDEGSKTILAPLKNDLIRGTLYILLMLVVSIILRNSPASFSLNEDLIGSRSDIFARNPR